MNPPLLDQHNRDNEHLRLLSLFQYVLSAIVFLFSCFPVIHMIIGAVILFAPGGTGPNQPPRVIGAAFIVFAGVIILAGWAFAVLILLCGRFLSQRAKYMFCFVIACLECMFMPFGTVLGVFTILVLFRPSVKAAFKPPPTW